MTLCRIDLDVARMDSPISSASSQTTVGPQMDLNSTFADEETSSIMLASNNDTTSVIILTSTESSSVSNISLTSMIGDEGGKIN